MGYNNKDFITSGISTQIGLASFVIEIAESIKGFFVRIQREQAQARR